MDYRFSLAVVSFVAAGVGAYLGAYSKRKGENRAIHEDLDNVVNQMKAVAQATKDIEAKIPGDMWDRQKRWEMKRDAFFAVAKELEAMESALSDFHVTCVAVDKEPNEAFMLDRKSKALDQLSEVSARLDAVRARAALVCEADVNSALYAAIALMRKIAQCLLRGDLALCANSLKDMIAANYRVKVAIRKELGMASSDQAKAASGPE